MSAKPWSSPLWNYLPELQALRKKRATWVEISKLMREAHGVNISPRSTRNFFVRSRTAKIPAGFDNLRKSEPVARYVKQVERLEGAD
jgi:hypothetical protein